MSQRISELDPGTPPYLATALIEISVVDAGEPSGYATYSAEIGDIASVSALFGLGANVAAFLASPSPANLAAAVTGETGDGDLVFANNAVLFNTTLSGTAVATGQFRSTFNGTGVPLSHGTAGFALTNNYASLGEVDLWSLADSSGGNQGFNFYQKLTSTTAQLLGRLYGDSTFAEFSMLVGTDGFFYGVGGGTAEIGTTGSMIPINLYASSYLFNDGGLVLEGATGGDQGVGTINLLTLYDSGAAPTGTAGSGYVRALLPNIISPTFSGTGVLSGTLGGGSIVGLTGFGIRDTSAAFDVTMAATSTPALTAGRILTLDMGNVAHTLDFNATANTITFPNAASYTLAGLSVAQEFTALQTFKNTTDSSSVDILRLEGDRATPTAFDSIRAGFYLSNDAGTQKEFGRLAVTASDIVAGTEDGLFNFTMMKAGVLTSTVNITANGINPVTNDAISLGFAGIGFSDLFLASGGIINWANGDTTITHSTGLLSFNSALAVSFAGLPATFKNTADTSPNQVLRLEGDRATPTAFDQIYQSWYLSNAAGTQIEFGRISMQTTDLTAGSEDGRFIIWVDKAGTLTNTYTIQSNAIYPTVDDTVALGAGGTAFSDLFLASGGIINWANGNVLLTHSTGRLIVGPAGVALAFQSGTGARTGDAVLVGGTVTVTNTTVTANTKILLTRKTAGGTIGDLTYTLSAGASFTINSASGTDTSTVSFMLVELN